MEERSDDEKRLNHKDTVIYSRAFNEGDKQGRAIIRADLKELIDQIIRAVHGDVFEGTIAVSIELKRESEG